MGTASQPAAQVILAPSRVPFQHARSIFLAGSTAPTSGPNWRKVLKGALADSPVTIMDPYRADWDDSWREDVSFEPFREQVEWELDMQEKAEIVVVYFHPETQAPLSLLELGLCARQKKAVVCCPEGYWKRGNVVFLCERFGIPLTENEEELEKALKARLEVDVNERSKS